MSPMCRMRGLARFVGWRGREAEGFCGLARIPGKGRGGLVRSRDLASFLKGPSTLAGLWRPVLIPSTALPLPRGDATAQILVDDSAFDAVGVGGNWQLRRQRRSFGASDANQYRGFESFLARQDTGCELSAAKTKTPLNAMFRGAFCVNLLTSPTPKCHICALRGHFSRNLLTSQI